MLFSSPRFVVAEVPSGHSVQRRRSERISKSLPLIVRGIDLLGQPFEERSSTLAVNLHGCRYVSKHHLPKNTWVTLEVPEEARRRHVRARVAWIQRPHSVREFFQIAVELESPSNIWNVSSPPADWQESQNPVDVASGESPEFSPRIAEPAASEMANSTERLEPDMTNEYRETTSAQPSSEASPAENPLLRQLTTEFERQAAEVTGAAAARAVERIERAVEDFAQLENNARENFSAQTSERQRALVDVLTTEFEKRFEHVRDLVQDLDRTAQALRAERDAALEAASRIAQSRLDSEAAESARAQSQAEGAQDSSASDASFARWRERLESEMALAQAQWNELLQSSIDTNIGRLVEQLAGRSQELLGSAEQRMADRFAELRGPLSQICLEAREALSSLRSALENELARASSSLTQMEHATARMREHSAQLENTSHNALDEMHRRLENILQAHSDEMGRRAENILSGVPQRLSSIVDSISQQAAERAIAEIDSKLTLRLEHASQLVHSLASRGAEADESLRLHRERLRQLSENNFREAAAQTAAVISGLRGDFESARKEALAKWNEEMDAGGVRAAQATSASIERSSEWFQQEARARMQVLVEQTLASASGSFEEKAADASRQFGTRLEEQSSGRMSQIHEQLNGLAAEIAGRTRSQLDEAGEAAAASFGQVLRRLSEQETENFTASSRNVLGEREREFGASTAHLLQNLEANGQASMEQFRAQMASQLESSVAEGRNALSAEFSSALQAHRAERESHERVWADELQRLSHEAVAKHQERLQNASDSWVVSSVRRLNEHGQSAIESLMRSADEAVRESCAKMFQSLSQLLRERAAETGAPGFNPAPESEGTSPSPGESATRANA
jgi:hypothetical protein